MNMKRLASVCLMLGSVPAFAKAPEASAPVAKAQDREVWITIGSEAVLYVNASLMSQGFAATRPVAEKGNLTALRLPESQLELVSKTMHDQFNRCGGFVFHESEAEARAAMNAPPVQSVAGLAASYTLDTPQPVLALQQGLQAPKIVETITMLAGLGTRYHTTPTGLQAANNLRDLWLSFIPPDRTDVEVKLRAHTSSAQPSVIATIQGSQFPDEIVVIGGHLDSTNTGGSSLPAPGADDDASGVATFTELFRVAMAQNYRPAKTVQFMAYAAEEVGLRGSKEIAQEYKAASKNVIGVLQLDMTNYTEATVDVGIVNDQWTNSTQNAFIGSLINEYVPSVTWAYTSCGYACSDHASWNNEGFPASIPFEGLFNDSNPKIHSAEDTLANSDATGAHALKFAKLAAAYMGELAEGVATPVEIMPLAASITAPAAGSSVSGSVNVTATASGTSGIRRVDLHVNGVFTGKDSTAPYTFSWQTGSLPNGNYTLTAKAYDLYGNPVESSSVTVTVSNSPGTAGYDATLKAPRCASASPSCDSGTLLNGRSGLGPEVNAPNTINNSCADGANGTYLADESNERIKVSTVDGTPFAPGKQVRVEATVFARNTLVNRVELYSAANATNPTWTLIGTVRPTAKGLQTLTATYTLPTGTVQAVRARYRASATASASPYHCGTTAYEDHDDLIFAVQP
jgi:leucyl aminopeptidase